MNQNKNLLIVLSFFLIILGQGCNKEPGSSVLDSSLNEPGDGKGGSLARFTIAGNYLYSVDHSSLNVYSLVDPGKPVFVRKKDLGVGIETIFPYQNHLFIGSSLGMFIYSLNNPEDPQFVSNYTHTVSCDPVFVSGNHAYITLRSGETRCQRGVNVLQVVDISNLKNPVEVNSIPMVNPKGLAVWEKVLFVCDVEFTIFDIDKPASPKFLEKKKEISASDIIPLKNSLIIMENKSIKQYSVASGGVMAYQSQIN